VNVLAQLGCKKGQPASECARPKSEGKLGTLCSELHSRTISWTLQVLSPLPPFAPLARFASLIFVTP